MVHDEAAMDSNTFKEVVPPLLSNESTTTTWLQPNKLLMCTVEGENCLNRMNRTRHSINIEGTGMQTNGVGTSAIDIPQQTTGTKCAPKTKKTRVVAMSI